MLEGASISASLNKVAFDTTTRLYAAVEGTFGNTVTVQGNHVKITLDTNPFVVKSTDSFFNLSLAGVPNP